MGLALSDPSGTFALPLEVISANGALKQISAIIHSENVRTVVVGLPITLHGEIGPQAKRVQRFVRRMSAAFPGILIETFDERLSSLTADRLAPKHSSPHRDARAAAVILDGYLSSHSSKQSFSKDTP